MRSNCACGTRLLACLIVTSICLYSSVCYAQSANLSRVNVRLITDEAEAVLAILAKRKANEPVTDADWQRLFSTDGYIRLKKREASMKRAFDDADFRSFVMSDQTAERAQALADTLTRWKRADVTRAASLALAYLPEDAHISARIYPVIKPKANSFVFEVKTDPAIFLYLDPAVTQEKFENTLAHELHHIGYGSSCPSAATSTEIAKLPENTQTLIKVIGAFGEGFAMLAAAGGPEIHPHAVSSLEDRTRWDRDVANFNDDLKKVEQFFLDVVAGRLTETQIEEKAQSFFGIQGPWYTVGWKMSVVIEKAFGRARLLECICDERKLLPTYNSAVASYNKQSGEHLAIWSPALLEVLQSPP